MKLSNQISLESVFNSFSKLTTLWRYKFYELFSWLHKLIFVVVFHQFLFFDLTKKEDAYISRKLIIWTSLSCLKAEILCCYIFLLNLFWHPSHNQPTYLAVSLSGLLVRLLNLYNLNRISTMFYPKWTNLDFDFKLRY